GVIAVLASTGDEDDQLVTSQQHSSAGEGQGHVIHIRSSSGTGHAITSSASSQPHHPFTAAASVASPSGIYVSEGVMSLPGSMLRVDDLEDDDEEQRHSNSDDQGNTSEHAKKSQPDHHRDTRATGRSPPAVPAGSRSGHALTSPSGHTSTSSAAAVAVVGESNPKRAVTQRSPLTLGQSAAAHAQHSAAPGTRSPVTVTVHMPQQ